MPKSKNAPVKDMYNMLNSWDVAQQFLGDIYATWHFVAIICGLSFCKYMHTYSIIYISFTYSKSNITFKIRINQSVHILVKHKKILQRVHKRL